ncbi:hypothetical protein SBE55_20015 [Mycolicibacterium sp. 141076]|uniref:hypothetical protein n=1 Tax=Mycolicibacterium sp. 141076 TaxID=3090599 RepID=UPI00299DD98E|nr:hypothetical protein [Mycolicibacterium sp. 141076]MDX1880092.1 hypothetical protein [Mycolicibacterium sp. 141076]
MSEHVTGPPESEVPAPAQETGTHHDHHVDSSDNSARADIKPGTSLVWVPCTRTQAPQDVRSLIRRRRDAAARSQPLDCGCRDPWACDCTDPPLTDRWVDASASAARHLLAQGHTPLLEIEVLQALWRRGGHDRRLAQHLHQLTDGVVA